MAKKVKMKKNKMKTHKASSKVFKKRQSGSIKITSQGINHNTGKNSAKRSREKRKGSSLHKSDYKRIKDLI